MESQTQELPKTPVKCSEVLKPPQTEPEKQAEQSVAIAGLEPENSAESEGKKWAEIIRKEGAGVLRGKFRKSWTFINPSGKEEQVSSEEGSFTGGGVFGNIQSTSRATSRVPESMSLDQFRYKSAHGTAYNTLIIDNYINDPNKKVFTYFVPVSNAPDNRGWVVPINFVFALSSERASQFVDQMKDKSDLMEDVFQNVYPRLTGKGKAERFVVHKMNIIDDIITTEKESFISETLRKTDPKRKPAYETVEVSSRSRMLNFSKPVGEIAS